MNRIGNLTSDWKWSIGLIHLGFLPLFIAAAFYYLERLSGCAGQDIFEVLNSNSFFFIHNRLTHVFSQWLPLLSFRLGFDLKEVLLVFSISSVLHHYLLSMLCLFLLKDYTAAFGILLVQYFGITYSFYSNPHLEIQYCISLAIVLQSVLSSKELAPVFRWSISFVAIFLMVNSYLPTASFIPFAIALNWKQVGFRNSLVYAMTILLSLGYKFIFLDTYVASVLDFQLVNSVPNSHIEGMSLFVSSLLDRMVVENVVVLFLLVLLVFKKRWNELFLLLLAILAYISLIVQFYGEGIYSEHVGLPINFFIVSTFIFLMSKFKKLRKVSLLVLVGFISFKSFFIFSMVGSRYSSETNALIELMNRTKCLSTSQLVYEEEIENLPFSHQALYQRSLLYSGAMGFNNYVGIMVKGGVLNNLADLGVPSPYKEKFKPVDYENGYFLERLNSKVSEIQIDTNTFPMKDEGFILVQENELCDGSS